VDSDWLPDLFITAIITTHRLQLLATDTIAQTKYGLSDLTPLTTETLLNTGFRLL
jgi:hypothetical protein